MSENRSEFKILISLIEIWKEPNLSSSTKEPDSQSCYYITDVSNIDIVESYKKLISTAQITFPRGTLIKKTYTKDMSLQGSGFQASVSDAGVLRETYTETTVLGDGEVQIGVGDRIRIYLGYTTDPAIARLTSYSESRNIYTDTGKLKAYKDAMQVMFNGYIAQCSVDTPITIKCENLAYGLKRKSCPNRKLSSATVNDLLAANGKVKLLESTGIELYPNTESIDINIGDIELNSHMTVADVLLTWSKNKLYTFLKEENGKVYLGVGRIYTTNIDTKDNLIAILNDNKSEPTIDFSYHVANNGLSIMKTDPLFIACKVSYVPEGKNKFASFVIRRNPEKPSEFDIVNENKSSKNDQKKKVAQNTSTVNPSSTPESTGIDVDLSSYNIISYTGSPGMSRDEVIGEAKKYLESFNQNGIEGSLTLFGDLALRTGTVVKLQDDLYPAKNGRYMVEEVRTTFGINGYRQTIKLPYCISRDNEQQQ